MNTESCVESGSRHYTEGTLRSTDALRVEVESKPAIQSQPSVGEVSLSALDLYAEWLGIRLQLIEARYYPIGVTPTKELRRRQRVVEEELLELGIIRPKVNVLPSLHGTEADADVASGSTPHQDDREVSR